MELVLAFAGIVGGVLLLTHSLSAKGTSYRDILAGNATLNPGDSFAGGSGGSSSASSGILSSIKVNTSGYTNPLQHVTHWERTDQGVDANMPTGAPIVAPGKIKILGVLKNWYDGQPFIYWQLLTGPDAGKVQYVAEQITNLAPVGAVLNAGEPIARYAPTGSGIEFGWATPTGQTLASTTGGYTEGEVTHAGELMRQWLDNLGAGAGAS